ncbi:hypothetical protein FIU88_19135 (plasmid) [Halomonas sp. THAF12]|uniref:hypothetical protein n=1 Tax=Halomonas sp. THAF12 TaxID=2587849 RepID=UPI0012693F71|nr:hypothetical protein [Halomonas sp. THAF12]QFT86827.1 hypothetical protein FIU88_17920 [Halomonas sp. THAF12]QFT87070.1 hypothetical protein FIU88_19135 [Halomonas sp. THAF12]
MPKTTETLMGEIDADALGKPLPRPIKKAINQIAYARARAYQTQLAEQLKVEAREMLSDGKSPTAVIQELAERDA